MRNGTVYRRHTVGPEGTLHAHDPASPVDPEGPCLGLAVIDAHDALMAPQVARMPRPPVPGEVCRRPEHHDPRTEEHTSELQSLMRTSYAVFLLKKKRKTYKHINNYD